MRLTLLQYYRGDYKNGILWGRIHGWHEAIAYFRSQAKLSVLVCVDGRRFKPSLTARLATRVTTVAHSLYSIELFFVTLHLVFTRARLMCY